MILGIFCISPSIEIETIASLIYRYLHLYKLSGRNQLQTITLLYNYVIKSLLEKRHAMNSQLYNFTLRNMTSRQQQKIKSSIVNMNNWLNGIFTTFDSLNLEFYPGSRLIDIFSSHISFHNVNHSFNKSKKAYCMKLDEIALELSSDPKSVVIITDASVKNNVAFSISYVYFFNDPLKKILHQ